MKEWLSWVGGATAWGLTLWMAKRFFEAKVSDAIKEAKAMAKRALDKNEELTAKINSITIDNLGKISSVHDRVIDEMNHHTKLFSETVQIAIDARNESMSAKMLVSEVDKKTDSQGRNMMKLGHALVDDLKNVKTQVKNLNNNLVLLKTTTEKKNVPKD